jgi:hypothetical protein
MKEIEEYMIDMKKENDMRSLMNNEEFAMKRVDSFVEFKKVFINGWNCYDWISIVVLLICIITHLDDIRDHTEYKARIHLNFMSINVIVISISILKSARIIEPKIGTLVMMLYYTVADMMMLIILYLIVLLTFSMKKLLFYKLITFNSI